MYLRDRQFKITSLAVPIRVERVTASLLSIDDVLSAVELRANVAYENPNTRPRTRKSLG